MLGSLKSDKESFANVAMTAIDRVWEMERAAQSMHWALHPSQAFTLGSHEHYNSGYYQPDLKLGGGNAFLGLKITVDARLPEDVIYLMVDDQHWVRIEIESEA